MWAPLSTEIIKMHQLKCLLIGQLRNFSTSVVWHLFRRWQGCGPWEHFLWQVGMSLQYFCIFVFVLYFVCIFCCIFVFFVVFMYFVFFEVVRPRGLWEHFLWQVGLVISWSPALEGCGKIWQVGSISWRGCGNAGSCEDRTLHGKHVVTLVDLHNYKGHIVPYQTDNFLEKFETVHYLCRAQLTIDAVN